MKKTQIFMDETHAGTGEGIQGKMEGQEMPEPIRRVNKGTAKGVLLKQEEAEIKSEMEGTVVLDELVADITVKPKKSTYQRLSEQAYAKASMRDFARWKMGKKGR